jgi:hypothetical protein
VKIGIFDARFAFSASAALTISLQGFDVGGYFLHVWRGKAIAFREQMMVSEDHDD